MRIFLVLQDAVLSLMKVGNKPTQIRLSPREWNRLVSEEQVSAGAKLDIFGVPVYVYHGCTSIEVLDGTHTHIFAVPPRTQQPPTYGAFKRSTILQGIDLLDGVDETSFTEAPANKIPSCECGSEKTGCGGHSTWCPEFSNGEAA